LEITHTTFFSIPHQSPKHIRLGLVVGAIRLLPKNGGVEKLKDWSSQSIATS